MSAALSRRGFLLGTAAAVAGVAAPQVPRANGISVSDYGIFRQLWDGQVAQASAANRALTRHDVRRAVEYLRRNAIPPDVDGFYLVPANPRIPIPQEGE